MIATNLWISFWSNAPQAWDDLLGVHRIAQSLKVAALYEVGLAGNWRGR